MSSQKSYSVKGLMLPVFLPSALFSIGDASLIPVIPAAALKLGADLPTAGLIAGMVTFGSLIFVVPAVRLVNRFGERRSMIVAGLTGAAAIGSLLFTNNLWLMALAVLITGSMDAIFGLARHGYMTEHVPFNYRARALSLLGGTFRAGGFLGPLLGALVISIWDLKAAYAVGTVVCLLAVVPLLFIKDDEFSKPNPEAKKSMLHVTKRELPKLATIGVGSAILAFTRAVRQIGLPLWGVYLGMPEAQIALYIGIAGALDFSLFFVSGQIMDRFGRRAAVIPTMLAMGLTLIAMVLATTPSIFLTIAILMSIANALGSGIILTLGSDLAPPDARNEFLATYRFIIDIGLACAPLALSGITAAVSLPAAFVSVGVLSLVGAGGMWHYLPKFGIR